MAQISKGDTFADGQQVTGARLNQLVDSSVLVVGAVTDQPAITAATVAIDDQMILADTSTATLKKVSVGDILGSSLPIVATTIAGTAITGTTVTTPIVNSSANNDVLVTPYDGVNVTGKPFNSPDGITATISSLAHGLTTGSLVQITASNTAYSGLYKITVTNADEFKYTVYPVAVLASGTCSYIKKATERIIGNQTVSGNVIVAGNETIEGNLRVVGDVAMDGNLNITGTLKVNGTTGYILYEVLEEGIPYWGATTATNYNGVFASTVFTKPSDEIWEFEVSYNIYGDTGYGMGVGVRYGSQAAFSGTYKFVEYYTVATHSYSIYHRTHRWKEGKDTVLTNETVKIDAGAGASSAMAMFLTSTTGTAYGVFAGYTTPIASSKFRIYKYKTA